MERRPLRLPPRDQATLRHVLDAARSAAIAAGSVDLDRTGHSASAHAADPDRSTPDDGPNSLEHHSPTRGRPWWRRRSGGKG